MTQLAALANTTELRGEVCITDAKGVTHRYEDEATAYAAWKDRLGSLEHRRGAFFEKATAPVAPKVAAAAPPVEAEAPAEPKKKSGRRKRS